MDAALKQQIVDAVPDEIALADMADLFKVFGDYTRLRIISLLFEADEICVGHIAEMLDMSQSSISHQLRVLKQARLVKTRREGKT
ncbi:metalloregulator ArsR/SmtB family transcription factor, partial [Eubacteriales bacterium OttesenSCG-928-N14]|nr:metalloregulator ArsR/SmtB family transcription factor [Eubacteriales bacterium OttesenSCG-928-N14]